MPRRNRTRTRPGKTAKSKELPLEDLERLVRKQPDSVYAWKQLGARFSEHGRKQEALHALEEAQALAPDDAEALAVLGRVTHQIGNTDKAVELLKAALELNPRYAKAHNYLAFIYYSQSRYETALPHAEKACEYAPHDVEMLNTLGNILLHTFQYERAEDVLKQAARLDPKKYISWNNLGNVQNALGDLDAGLDSYYRAHHAAPTAPGPYSNIITTCHYHPHKSAPQITELCKQWTEKFPASHTHYTFKNQLKADKRLRVGMISDGFRGHPVGRMVTSALEAVPHHQMEFYFYSTNNASDGITERLKAVATQWMTVQPLRDEEVIEQVRGDQIDILIDLAGHNAGNRVLAVAERLAPVQVKWVGGLINTTGVQAMDYLLSDNIETPEGVDDQYVENLIRLPDDYICYVPPNGYEPNIKALPALKNGYITLGCFNNATKLNDELLGHWAGIMHQLPESRLFLKSMQYQSQGRRKKIIDCMADNGIEERRLIIEGPSPHAELLDAYNRVDIALDPWPYSGGLTTCEAFLMGVPVVTLPGPTFAGRHSATHLVNAGMPELVVSSWQEYEERVLELAADLDSLSTIRQHLRQILLESPVCDAPRFAGHLTTALRAVWQRHCEGKAPTALSMDEEGKAKFADELLPMSLLEPANPSLPSTGFTWQFSGKVIALDNGAKLLRNNAGLDALRSLKAFGIVAFDPASRTDKPERFDQLEDLQFFPHVALGDGKPGTLYATLDPKLSSTLTPLPADMLPPAQAEATRVLAQLPINTIALDRIEGLESLDWLILDQYSDAIAILENGEKALRNTLLLQVRLAFQPTHKHQPDFAQVSHWASRHGFRFYRFNDEKHISHFPDDLEVRPRQATDLESADALYLPSHERMLQLSVGLRMKLAFLLDTVFGVRDIPHKLLSEIDPEAANDYLKTKTGARQIGQKVEKKVFVVGFPKSGTSTLQKSLELTGFRSAHWQTASGNFVGPLMYKGLQDQDDPWFYLGEYDAITQADVCLPEDGLNFWPNLDLTVIKKIEERHPNCLFLLNYRDPERTVSSIKRWNNMQDRFIQAEIPGLPAGKGNDSELVMWIEQHMATIRQYFSGKDNFLEIDITDNQAAKLLGGKLGVEIAWWGVANKNNTPLIASENKVTGKDPDIIDEQAHTLINHLLAGSKASAERCLKEMLRNHDLNTVRQAIFSISDNKTMELETAFLAGQVLRANLPTLAAPPEYPPFSISNTPFVYVVGTSNARGFGSSPYFLSFFSSIGAEAYLLQDREYHATLIRMQHIVERLEPRAPVLLILGAEPRLLLENRFEDREYAFGELMQSDYIQMEIAARRYYELGKALSASARGPLYFLTPLPTLNREANTLSRYMIECMHTAFESSDLGIIDPFEEFIDASTGLMNTRLQIIKNETELHFNHDGLEIIMSKLVDQGLIPKEALTTPKYQWDNMVPVKVANSEIRIWNDPARSLKSNMTAATMMMDRFADLIHGCYLQTPPQQLVVLNSRQGFLPTRLGIGLAPKIMCISLDKVDAMMCEKLITFMGRLDITVSTGGQASPEAGDLIICAYPDDDTDFLERRIDETIATMNPGQILALIPEGLSSLDIQPAGYAAISDTSLRRRHISPSWQCCRVLHFRRID